MKKRTILLLSLLLMLSLAACSGNRAEESPAEEIPLWQPFDYIFTEPTVVNQETLAEDGTLLSTCYYTIPVLAAEGNLTKAQQASIDTFNAAMEEILAGCELLFESISEDAKAQYDYRDVPGFDWYGPYTDEMTYTVHATPYAVFVNFYGQVYTGGAHPGKGNVCYLFDLENCEMVWIDDMADGNAFRSAVAEEVLAQINQRGLAEGYYEDYETTAREQNGVQYFFSDGQLTVYFQDYTLGPYAAGYPVFTISHDVYRGTLNERGLRLLGYTE